jgi:hypothetical protein
VSHRSSERSERGRCVSSSYLNGERVESRDIEGEWNWNGQGPRRGGWRMISGGEMLMSDIILHSN